MKKHSAVLMFTVTVLAIVTGLSMFGSTSLALAAAGETMVCTEECIDYYAGSAAAWSALACAN